MLAADRLEVPHAREKVHVDGRAGDGRRGARATGRFAQAGGIRRGGRAAEGPPEEKMKRQEPSGETAAALGRAIATGESAGSRSGARRNGCRSSMQRGLSMTRPSSSTRARCEASISSSSPVRRSSAPFKQFNKNGR